MTYKKHRNNRRYNGRDPNSKKNRFKGTFVEKSKFVEERKRVYEECKAAGMSDMQALVKCLEIGPKD